MDLTTTQQLLAISPIDGRYYQTVSGLSEFFSEYALIKYRIRVEIEYLLALAEGPLARELVPIATNTISVRRIYTDFDISGATEIKDIEETTKHDVKAVEYYVKKKLSELGLDDHIEFVHFGLTSQDINNTAVPLLFRDFFDFSILPSGSNIT